MIRLCLGKGRQEGAWEGGSGRCMGTGRSRGGGGGINQSRGAN